MTHRRKGLFLEHLRHTKTFIFNVVHNFVVMFGYVNRGDISRIMNSCTVFVSEITVGHLQ